MTHTSKHPIIPLPNSVDSVEGCLAIDEKTRLVVNGGSENVGLLLQGYLRPGTGLSLPLSQEHRSGDIRIHLDTNLKTLGPEGYELKVTQDSALLVAPQCAGLLHGIQTLRQLLPPRSLRSTHLGNSNWHLPCVRIEDRPRFPWRGLHLDVARHFMPKAFLLKLVELLAFHKLNVLHLHLTDDQGWRIEIQRHPELTRIGAWRSRSHDSYEGRPHGGFYTQDDLREVVAYAAMRGVTVMPEIEMPGHCQAAIAAYPELGHGGPPPEVSTVWGIHDQIFNVCDGTVQFLKDVLTEVIDVFPSTYVHLGGDEVPIRRWEESPDALSRMADEGLARPGDLRRWLLAHMARFLADHGRQAICWDDVLDDLPEGECLANMTVMSWRGGDGGVRAARAGMDVLMAPFTNTYLDSSQTPLESTEPVAGWGFLPLEKVYGYDPLPLDLSAEEARHIRGAQCQLWTEHMPDTRAVEYMAFPRVCAFAETVWTSPVRKDFLNFTDRLSAHFDRLTALDVNFCNPGPPWILTGGWAAGEIGEQWVAREWDATDVFSMNGTCQILFRYTSGLHRLDIAWAEWVVDGTVVGRDEHPGTTGARNEGNEYRVALVTSTGNRRRLLRALVRADGGSDSTGEIYVRIP